jgi:hypothetical protein
MGLLFVEVLPRDATGGAAVLQCRRCRVDAASVAAILSRDFHGRLGRAYLFDRVYVRPLPPIPIPDPCRRRPLPCGSFLAHHRLGLASYRGESRFIFCFLLFLCFFLPNEFNSISVVSRIVRYRSANSGRVCCAANFFAPCGVLPAEILIF